MILKWPNVNYHGEFLAEDEESELSTQIQQEVAATDVAVDMERHLPFQLLPLCDHLIPLQPVVPSLQLQNLKTADLDPLCKPNLICNMLNIENHEIIRRIKDNSTTLILCIIVMIFSMFLSTNPRIVIE